MSVTALEPTVSSSATQETDQKSHGIDQLGLRVHKQIIISGYITNSPKDVVYMQTWFEKLIKIIDMKILSGPYLVYCDMEGNRGLTGVAIIETSHIALHSWDEISPGLIELDIFSCKGFNPNDVIDALREFGLVGIDFKCMDRTHTLKEEKMWVVYQTKNKINGKVYIGVHGDYQGKYNYLGSGRHLKNAVKKYGKENFTHSILKVFSNVNDAYEYEKSIVNAEFVADPTTYNLTQGGRGSSSISEETKNKISESKKGKSSQCHWVTNGTQNLLMNSEKIEDFLTNNPGWNYGRIISESARAAISTANRGRVSHRKGKTGIISKETRAKMRESILKRFKDGYNVWNKGLKDQKSKKPND